MTFRCGFSQITTVAGSSCTTDGLPKKYFTECRLGSNLQPHSGSQRSSQHHHCRSSYTIFSRSNSAAAEKGKSCSSTPTTPSCCPVPRIKFRLVHSWNKERTDPAENNTPVGVLSPAVLQLESMAGAKRPSALQRGWTLPDLAPETRSCRNPDGYPMTNANVYMLQHVEEPSVRASLTHHTLPASAGEHQPVKPIFPIL